MNALLRSYSFLSHGIDQSPFLRRFIKGSVPLGLSAAGLLCAPQLLADPFAFSTGSPDGRIATASRLPSSGKIEIETADDFVTTASSTVLTGATFTGLLPIECR